MHQFNVKSLTFYTIAITSVLLVFKVVTAYGESQLKAPKSISGKYYITLAENLSNCKQNTLVLDIQQSGIFLNASLSTPSNQEISTYREKNLSLNGKSNNNSFSLSGRVDNTRLCNAIPETLQASLVPEGGLSGQITFKDVPKSIKFNAILQKPQEQSTQSFK
ncbi:MAG: hypothetical protein KME29_35275 [Calothrix sp. FI2-JRJ7]|jgi:hypothetical protein|nr:hypothetical protein [Calothrix sp. FI2-JRJ7]